MARKRKHCPFVDVVKEQKRIHDSMRGYRVRKGEVDGESIY